MNLQNTVAGFGAKIQSLENDVKTLKDDVSNVKTIQQSEKVRVDTLQDKISAATNASQSSFTAGVQNETAAWMKNLTEHCSLGVKNVSGQLALINETFSQKIKNLEDEEREHQTKLDGLYESFANVSSHVNSIESEWPKFKMSNQKIELATDKNTNDVGALKANVDNLTASVRDIQTNLLVQQSESKKVIDSSSSVAEQVSIQLFKWVLKISLKLVHIFQIAAKRKRTIVRYTKHSKQPAATISWVNSNQISNIRCSKFERIDQFI